MRRTIIPPFQAVTPTETSPLDSDRTDGIALLVCVLAIQAACATRPTSIDNPGFPARPAVWADLSKLPQEATPIETIALVPSLQDSARVEGSVRVTVSTEPHEKLKVWLRHWAADAGIYFFRVTLVNNANQTSPLKGVQVRLVVGEDERVEPINMDQASSGGDKSVASAVFDASRSYMDWRSTHPASPERLRSAFRTMVEDIGRAKSELVAKAKEARARVQADIDREEPPIVIVSVSKTSGAVLGRRNEQTGVNKTWSKELATKFISWRDDVLGSADAVLREVEARQDSMVNRLEDESRFDLAGLTLNTSDLSQVLLLPDGDETRVLVAFHPSRTRPLTAGDAGVFTIYGVPVAFSEAGLVTKRANFRFPFVMTKR